MRNALTWQFLTYCFIESTHFPLSGKNLSIKTNASCNQTRLCSIVFLWHIYFVPFCFCDRFAQGVCEYFWGKNFELMPPFMSHGDALTYQVCHQICFPRCQSEGFRIVPFRSVFEVLYRVKKHRDQGNLNANVVAAGMAQIGLMLIPDGHNMRWCKKFSFSRQVYFENPERRSEKTSPPHACWPHWRNNCQDVPRIVFLGSQTNCLVNVCPPKGLGYSNQLYVRDFCQFSFRAFASPL